ncbi:hypothetical protein [Phascolarctobacterium succinatutens]|uniref:hypothetical protein n=1 Tax=Phascolarctobacterium succinatutens TaxID=626940 RepID=UPI0026EFC7C6|nr:hypothetical protein [Phascolarctobacterium succinatutens]
MTISGIIYPKCLKNEKDIKITKVGLEAEAAELEDAEAVEVNDLKDTAAVSNAAIDEKQYIAIGR